ncbi:hypothetical protein M2139_002020 [Enterococcus sp. PF1-24]|uniref:hypothetical protein n=1 Tax=unclassified Enterococcus TaxID=2608891 RepID=UPI002476E597|nr:MULTISPECIES: hypothetical protein [unclassified Enterococcus]MDH6365019.1 hypothetical protein [Enterococcus sp. PFB1-1]MDH6402120.1 hypothetical protein [Enterococcus sp. PF1-24]
MNKSSQKHEAERRRRRLRMDAEERYYEKSNDSEAVGGCIGCGCLGIIILIVWFFVWI